MKNVTDTVFYVGVNDHTIDLFEGMYEVPNGVAYNSYVVIDREISVFDTVDAAYTEAWLSNVAEVLGDKTPAYLIVQHMEPDHSASIEKFVQKYPETKVVGNAKTFVMLHQFFDTDFTKNQVVVADIIKVQAVNVIAGAQLADDVLHVIQIVVIHRSSR